MSDDVMVTFEELVAHGVAAGVPVYDGIPWSFDYKGHHFTNENNDCYLTGMLRFNRGDILVVSVDGALKIISAPSIA